MASNGLEGLKSVIAGLLSEPVEALDPAELAGQLVDLACCKTQLAAYEARVTAVFDQAGTWSVDGSRTARAWLMRHCKMSPQEAATQVRLARRLAGMPATRAALEAGDITAEVAQRLGKLAHSPRRVVREAFAEAEETLLSQARDLPYADFERVARYWESLVDPDGTDATAADDYDSRALHVSEMLRGVIRVDGTLDPIGGAIFLAELTKLERALFDEDWETARQTHGDDTRVEHLSRTPAQRRADALTEMARRSAACEVGMDRDGLPRPLFVVHIGPDTVERMCELATGTPISPGLLVPQLGEADIERIIYGPRRRVIELSRRARFFRGGLRRAIELRDRHCQHPGCTVPAEYSDIDHIKAYAHGGETTQDNGRSECKPHNRWNYNHTQRRTPGPDPP